MRTFFIIRNLSEEIFFFALFLVVNSPLHAWPRLGDGATAVTQNTGNKAVGFAVSVGTTTPVLVYSGADSDREVYFQNTSATYDVDCGTFSKVNATAGTNRWLIRKSQSVTSNGSYNVYCIADPTAGSGTVEITGNVEFDSKDR